MFCLQITTAQNGLTTQVRLVVETAELVVENSN